MSPPSSSLLPLACLILPKLTRRPLMPLEINPCPQDHSVIFRLLVSIVCSLEGIQETVMLQETTP